MSSAKHLLKLFKNVAKGTPSWSTSPSELLRKTFKSLEASESLAKGSIRSLEWILAAEGVLGLLVASHTSLIINPPLAVITKRLVRIVDLSKLLLGLRRVIDIRVVLFGKLEVTFLDVCRRGIPVHAEHIVEVILSTTSTASSRELSRTLLDQGTLYTIETADVLPVESEEGALSSGEAARPRH